MDTNLTSEERLPFDPAEESAKDIDWEQVERTMWSEDRGLPLVVLDESDATRALESARHALESDQYAETPIRDLAVALVNAATRALLEMRSPDDGARMRKEVEGIKLLLQSRGAKLAEANLLNAARVRIERETGVLLSETVSPGKPSRARRNTTLPEGINYNQSSDWQHLAEIPKVDFEYVLADMIAQEKEITTAALVNYWHENYRPTPAPDSDAKGNAPNPPPNEEDEGGSKMLICPECGAIFDAAVAQRAESET